MINLELNKNNPDYLIEGKIKKKTLIYPFSKHSENFIITPLRNELKVIKLNNIYIEEYPLNDKNYEKIQMVYNYNPGFIRIKHQLLN